MRIKLIEIPGIRSMPRDVNRVMALSIDGACPAIAALSEWSEKEPANYKKIMTVLKLLGSCKRVRDENKVKRCATIDDIYEARAHTKHARLMFFYDESDSSVVICTNAYWKNKGNQNTAFVQCEALKQIYEDHKKQ